MRDVLVALGLLVLCAVGFVLFVWHARREQDREDGR